MLWEIVCGAPLKIRSQCDVQHGFLHHFRLNSPTVVRPEIHSEQYSAQPDAITRHQRVAEVIDFDRHDRRFACRAFIEIDHIERVVAAVWVFALPGGTEVEEADQLKVAPEIAQYGLSRHQVFENGYP